MIIKIKSIIALIQELRVEWGKSRTHFFKNSFPKRSVPWIEHELLQLFTIFLQLEIKLKAQNKICLCT